MLLAHTGISKTKPRVSTFVENKYPQKLYTTITYYKPLYDTIAHFNNVISVYFRPVLFN